MAGYNTTIIPVSFAPGGTVYINASSTSNTVVINPGTPSNPITAASTAGVLTPAMLLATSYANAISTAADDATTKSSAAYANAVANAAALYQTTAELSANVAKLTSNNSTNFGGYTWATPAALGTTTANSANFTTVNAASHTVGSNFIANTTGISTTGFIAATGSITTNGAISSTTGTGRVFIATDSGGSISLGRADGVASAPYIDFNSGATSIDFDARIAVTAGNGTVGAAPLTITSSTLTSISNTLTIGTAAYHVANGNMGLGISTPGNILTLSRNQAALTQLNVYNANTTVGGQSAILLQAGTGNGLQIGQNYNNTAFIYTNDAAPIAISTSATERMRIAATGNVGISNTAPNATLAVTGTANISGVVTLGSTLTTASYSKTTATIVGSLVAAATAGAGARSFVTDSTVVASGNFGAIVAGTGANPVPVYSDGTNWRIG